MGDIGLFSELTTDAANANRLASADLWQASKTNGILGKGRLVS